MRILPTPNSYLRKNISSCEGFIANKTSRPQARMSSTSRTGIRSENLLSVAVELFFTTITLGLSIVSVANAITLKRIKEELLQQGQILSELNNAKHPSRQPEESYTHENHCDSIK